MRLEQLVAYIQTSPAITLLRSPNAAYILHFLYCQFKRPGKLVLPLSELQEALTNYCELLHESYPEALRDRPEQYLSSWCSGESRWLHRFVEAGRNEPMYQLTRHTEDVFVFLDRALEQGAGFVGTESRLRLIISTLADLHAGASTDPQVRLSLLRQQRDRLNEEIDKVQRDGVAARYEPATIRERFATAVALLKQLLADFRAVEDRFKEITHQVQQRQTHGTEARGSILEFALDSEDLLKQEDQGVSFFEFQRFILSPEHQDQLQEIISGLLRIQELSEQAEGLAVIRRMVPSLIAEAEKVMRTNQRLSATLRRLLDSRATADRRRLAQVLTDICRLGASLAKDAPVADVGLTVDTGVHVELPLSRTIWVAPHRFATIDLTEHAIDDEQRLRMFKRLAEMPRLDWRLMRDRIRNVTSRLSVPTLADVVREYPVSVGVVELLGYIQIARSDGHIVSRTEAEEIVLPAAGQSKRTIAVRAPLILFMAQEGQSNVKPR